MEVHQLRYFIEVVRTGRFTAAAEHCHVSQPSLSQQIRKLEEELGEALFLRTASGAVLTDMGRDFLPRAERVLAELRMAQEDAAARRGLMVGELRLGAIPTVAPYLLPRLANGFCSKYSEVTLELLEDVTDGLERRLQNGQLDMALMSISRLADSFRSRFLLKDELLVTMPVGHGLTALTPLSLGDLEQQPLVLMHEAHCLSQQSLSLCRNSGVEPTIRIRSSQMETVHALVEAGMGISFTPAMALGTLRDRRLQHSPIAPEPVYRDIGLVWLASRDLSKLMKTFMEFAFSSLAEPQAGESAASR